MSEVSPNSHFSFEKPPEETEIIGHPPQNPSAEQIKLEKEYEASLLRGALSLVSQGTVPHEVLKDIRPHTKTKPNSEKLR